jgi:hypothetical protein
MCEMEVPMPDSLSLFPKNVERLRSRGVNFSWREAEHDLRVSCPMCAGVMTLHEEMPWHYCAGITCSAHLFTFDEVVLALPVDQAEVLP